ncbi:MAG: hypothetical protein JNG84_08755 [Archangium sp.]|nr:hypothetical protein [Archangium sp.]
MVRSVLLTTLTLCTLALAEPAYDENSAKDVIEQGLVSPLAAKEAKRDRLSRARPMASARRIRVLETAPKRDEKNAPFFTFAIDERHGFRVRLDGDAVPEDAWRKDTVVGCVYPATREVFIQQREHYRPAAILLGKRVATAPEHTCRAAPETVVQR